MPRKANQPPILARVERLDGSAIHQRFWTIKSARHWIKGLLGAKVRQAMVDGQVIWERS